MESNHVRDLMEAYSSIYAENEEVEQLDEEMTTSHPFKTGKPGIPSAPTLHFRHKWNYMLPLNL